MRYSLFFSLLLLFSAYSQAQRDLIIRFFNYLLDAPPPEAEETSLVLAVDPDSGQVVIANIPIIRNKNGTAIYSFLFLCPAEDEAEKKINREDSKTENALFIKETYGDLKLDKPKSKKKKSDENEAESKADFDDVKNIQFMEYDCIDAVKPSPRHVGSINRKMDGIKIDIYLVGFEVFFGEKYQSLKSEDYSKFTKIDKKKFRWFNVLIIRFESEKGNVLSVNNEFFSDEATRLAPKFEFGEKKLDPKINQFAKEVFYNKFDIEHLYSPGNQQNVFDRLFEDQSERESYFNISQKRYLVENHLTALNSFVSPVLEQAAHTYANIAPMWTLVKAKSWKRVENYFKLLSQGLLGIHLITGTHGTLKLKGKEVYLDSDNGAVRVPREFWKLVQYKRKEFQFYNMLIVTVNNPYEDVPSEICPTSECEKYGWEYIEQRFHPMGRTVCCEVTEKIINLLYLNGHVDEGRVLNLREVPHLENEKLTLNVTQCIEDRKKQSVHDPTIPCGDVKYRNQKDYVLESEKKTKKEDKGGNTDMFEVTKQFIRDYTLPYLNSLFTKQKEELEEKSPLLHELNDEIDEKKPLLDEENLQAEGKEESGDQKSLPSEEISPSSELEGDQRNDGETKKTK